MIELPHEEAREFGARLRSDGRCTWSVWSPRARTVTLIVGSSQGSRLEFPASRQPRGMFTATLPDIAEGTRYWYRVNEGPERPDPASRWQPDGVHGASAVFSPERFLWSDSGWQPPSLSDLVIYELHVGTFTREGTFDAICARLPRLRRLGINALELMPVAQFAGARGWGYDGVYWMAPHAAYGGPRALQRLIDACHSERIAVILDVVYNHFGPEGNYLGEFARWWVPGTHTPWGEALSIDRARSAQDAEGGVRDLILQSVRQWVRDYHVDGLRLDAVHAMSDTMEPHIVAEIAQVAHDEARRQGRTVWVFAEDGDNNARVTTNVEDGGWGLDAQWTDDFHHCVHVLLTGETANYYADYAAAPRLLVKALCDNFAYDGAHSHWRGRAYGTTARHLPAKRFIASIQTHDQVGNRPLGDRLHANIPPAAQRLAACLLLLSPFTPLLFMGEEYGEVAPFPYFGDFSDERLRASIRRGRLREHAAHGLPASPDPFAPSTCDSARLTWSWPVGSHAAALRRLYRDVLRLRHRFRELLEAGARRASLAPDAEIGPFLHWNTTGDERLTAVFHLSPTPSVPPKGVVPSDPLLFDSEWPRYRARERCSARRQAGEVVADVADRDAERPDPQCPDAQDDDAFQPFQAYECRVYWKPREESP